MLSKIKILKGQPSFTSNYALICKIRKYHIVEFLLQLVMELELIKLSYGFMNAAFSINIITIKKIINLNIHKII